MIRPSALGLIACLWGVGGVLTILIAPCVRLWELAMDPLSQTLDARTISLYATSIGFMAYTEGYRGFQKQFSPRVIARGIALAQRPRPLHVLLAPMFCMGMIHATRKRLMIGWGIPAGVVCLVIGIRYVPQPWRGAIDAGVIVGLSWGVASILWFGLRALQGRSLPVPPDLPMTGIEPGRLV